MGTAAKERNRTFVLAAFDTNGLIAEHWDVVQDKATVQESKSGLPMFGDTCPTKA
jgi:predicted SnoaL-like aldol condensation-catalyzing enzyme